MQEAGVDQSAAFGRGGEITNFLKRFGISAEEELLKEEICARNKLLKRKKYSASRSEIPGWL